MGEQSESSGEANFVIEFLLKMPEIVCIKVFLFPEFPLSLGFCGEAGNEVSSEETMPSSFSMSLRADEDFFISLFLEFRATGIPNLAGSEKREKKCLKNDVLFVKPFLQIMYLLMASLVKTLEVQ